jgi:hypothetical protein
MKANFLDLHAAADFLGPGAVEIDRYQTEITDIVRRRGVFGQRMKQVPATGHPSRFFEETAIASPTGIQAGTAELAADGKRRGEVRRRGGEGRVLCALRSESEPVVERCGKTHSSQSAR